ncbi:3-[(3aS,4S,7aS)-7a-methyl-1,5-dioxo-octahydro-1H-inden-4-yl]propanoyl:CoA ligase-like [Babylonia areolata]|uniref:3-[(3aS,4S,7aS)-7a-methyl-1, 5-dioxo-octahydro-1H-inden-4-yl]propanoyl:CoA ligase-like n=1 Tax=Babylonia areolata TaxID=304850 RepID=UPI003FD38762
MPQFQTMPEVLQHWAQEKPESAAFIFRDKNQRRNVLTWASLYTLAGRFAAVLRGKGIARGDLVINTLPNSPERMVCDAGIWMAGAASVNGQCLMADGSDLLNTITQSRAPAILMDPDITGSPWNVLKNHVVMDDEERVTSSQLACVQTVVFVRRVENEGRGDFIGQLKAQEEWFQAEEVKPEDDFCFFTTSGSTGFSKLVIGNQGTLIHFILHNKPFIKKVFGEKVHLNTGQMGWLGGYVIFSVVSGTTYVTCDMRAGIPEDMPQFLWTSIQEEKCDTAGISPVYLPKLAEIMETGSQKSQTAMVSSTWRMDTVALGSLPIQQFIVQAGLKVAHNVLIEYGLTDIGIIGALVVTDSQTFTDHDSGKPFADLQVKIVSVEDEAKPCVPGQVGHILVKGLSMMKGYLNNPKATADAFTEDGFFRTGDVGRLDERGHLIVDGRGSDAIMRGIYAVYPSWIEKRLRECPGVDDVIVIGVPDTLLHEELCACVVLKSDGASMEQVRQFAEGMFVSKDDPQSACPRYFLKFDSYPETGTGKPDRKVIKTQAAQRLGLISASD